MPRDGNESDFRRVLYGMFVFWSEVIVYVDGVATGELLISCVARKEVCLRQSRSR